jgi:hypothetical protein
MKYPYDFKVTYYTECTIYNKDGDSAVWMLSVDDMAAYTFLGVKWVHGVVPSSYVKYTTITNANIMDLFNV